jgi:hypothetical protein
LFNKTTSDIIEIEKPLKNQIITEGDKIKLTVQVSDKNTPGNWFKNGEPIQPDNRTMMEV